MAKRVTIRLPEELIARAKAYAAAQGTSMTSIVREHLETLTVETGAPGTASPLQEHSQRRLSRDEAVRQLELQAIAKEPVLITGYGRARSVMISIEEYCRLKSKAGEPVPSELNFKRAVTVRERAVPTGYDTSDLAAAVRQMADDLRSGRMRSVIDKELSGVRRLFANADGRRGGKA